MATYNITSFDPQASTITDENGVTYSIDMTQDPMPVIDDTGTQVGTITSEDQTGPLAWTESSGAGSGGGLLDGLDLAPINELFRTLGLVKMENIVSGIDPSTIQYDANGEITFEGTPYTRQSDTSELMYEVDGSTPVLNPDGSAVWTQVGDYVLDENGDNVYWTAEDLLSGELPTGLGSQVHRKVVGILGVFSGLGKIADDITAQIMHVINNLVSTVFGNVTDSTDDSVEYPEWVDTTTGLVRVVGEISAFLVNVDRLFDRILAGRADHVERGPKIMASLIDEIDKVVASIAGLIAGVAGEIATGAGGDETGGDTV